ncbi:hypothetical protein T484DRAFT_3632198 [Baffinella frigidus]|nr:hypothetical protein T484DRAFT_3632198 [Cryptophyta sp. CCMP2293]
MLPRASMEDIVSRAVRLLTSPKGNVTICCSDCGDVAIRTTTEALQLGGGVGTWSRNPSAGALLLRTRDSTDDMRMLLVKKGAVVLNAQQVICAGLEHDLKVRGFRTHLRSETHHQCHKCATTPGTSMRLRIDALLATDTEIAYMDATIRMRVGEDAKVRMCCSVCSDGLHKGAILPPPRTPTMSSLATTHVACAMGAIAEPGKAHDTHRHAQLLYFSRHTNSIRETGILVWVIDQGVSVIEVPEISDVFSNNAASYDLVSTNKQCQKHQTFPRPCAVCAKTIRGLDAATTVDLIDGYVNAQL